MIAIVFGIWTCLEMHVFKSSKKSEDGVTIEFRMVRLLFYEKQKKKQRRTSFKLESMKQMVIQKIARRLMTLQLKINSHLNNSNSWSLKWMHTRIETLNSTKWEFEIEGAFLYLEESFETCRQLSRKRK